MSISKDRYYWTQLRLALTSGQWSAKYPSKDPHGTALTWSELFRKFNKHCKGFQDIAQVASQTHALALLLSANFRDEDQDDQGEEFYPLELGQDCILPEERIEEANVGYETLKELKSTNFDVTYYAYALGNPSECLSHLSSIPDLLSLHNHIPSQSDTATKSSAHTHYMGLHMPFSTASSLSSAGGSFVSLAESSAPEIKDGRAWALTETLRSICLKGMSHEKLSPNDPHTALKAYGASLPLFTMIDNLLSDPPLPKSPAQNLNVFLQHRELWRWAERLLWRAIAVSAQLPGMDVWTWLRQYSTCSAHWPSTFRTSHRSAIYSLHLRAFILRYHPTHLGERGKDWLPLARAVANDYRGVLSTCTSFPRAGERNVRVEDFVDLCAGVWEAAGANEEGAGWVLDILWWATRLTFNSHRVLRHMTRLLHASGDTPLARRTLMLYVQVVGKAYEASRADAQSSNSGRLDLSGEEDVEDEDSDWDSDRSWVQTLVIGARMLCRFAASQSGLEGLKEAKEAGTCIEKARTRLHAKDGILLSASLDLAEGVWNVVMALKEQDPHSRPTRLAAAHNLFQRACSPPTSEYESSTFEPDPAALYHLALSFARPGPTHDLEQAILHAGRAVEGDVREIRFWHLLGLLLATAEKWNEAREILERGAEIEDEDSLGRDNEGEDGSETGEGQTVIDSHTQTLQVPGQVEADLRGNDLGGSVGPTNGSSYIQSTEDSVLSEDVESPKAIRLLSSARIPSPATLLAPARDHPPSSKYERFEQALQLRMTQGVLTEVIEGAEGAEEKWLEVFSWVAERRAADASEPTLRASSIDGTRASEKAPSFVISPPGDTMSHPEMPAPVPVRYSIEVTEQETLQPVAIPITISPATPETEHAPRARGKSHGATGKRSSSIDRDTSKSKKVQQMLKNRVHKEQVRITTISKTIANGVVRTGSLKRPNSTPDFHAILRQTSYQASSIHSRRRVSSILHHAQDRTPTESPPPPPTPIPPPPPAQDRKANARIAHTNRLLADLWLMSAATFRRLGKIEQAKGAIQEAEVRDEANPGVWVQLGLYYVSIDRQEHAMDAFQKALFISPDDVSASVHLARLYLSRHETKREKASATVSSAGVDLAAGMLSHLTHGNGWDVPEAWYYLAKAYALQGRRKRERE
ncbi:hypothetical protein H0H81_004451, partial [Sphagnurus paluster]